MASLNVMELERQRNRSSLTSEMTHMMVARLGFYLGALVLPK